jgi:hypothetical protein
MRTKILDEAIAQFIALVAFFAFLAFQYVSLKWFSRREGQPQLWYLPAYGFRLVIRNLPRKKTLMDIKYRVLLRTIVPASSGASVKTFQDELLLERQDFFLFPGNDQILVDFRLDNARDDEGLIFVLTDKLGHEKFRSTMADSDHLVCDYSATLKNLFNFNVGLNKRVEISGLTLRSLLKAIRQNDTEQCFKVERIRNVS